MIDPEMDRARESASQYERILPGLLRSLQQLTDEANQRCLDLGLPADWASMTYEEREAVNDLWRKTVGRRKKKRRPSSP